MNFFMNSPGDSQELDNRRHKSPVLVKLRKLMPGIADIDFKPEVVDVINDSQPGFITAPLDYVG